MVKTQRERKEVKMGGKQAPVEVSQGEGLTAKIKISTNSTIRPCINCRAALDYTDNEDQLDESSNGVACTTWE